MKFSCQESCGGQCCTMGWSQAGAFVFLTKQDQLKIQATYGISLLDFANLGEFTSTRFAMYSTRQWFLKGKDDHCYFFENGKCKIYGARPVQCQTFPYWPENIVEGKWVDKVRSSCPGIDQGEENGVGQWLLAQQLRADRELAGNAV